jgi:hypothetical protein
MRSLTDAARSIRIAQNRAFTVPTQDPRSKLAEAIRYILHETGGGMWAGWVVKLMMDNVSPAKAERVLEYLRRL